MDTEVYVKGLLNQYYYLKWKERNKLNERSLVVNEMINLKAISYNKVSGLSEDRQSKLIRLTEKKDRIEKEIENIAVEHTKISIRLHLDRLDESDLSILDMIYYKRASYDEIANKLYYTGKSYVSRKHKRIIETMAQWQKKDG